MYHLKIRSEIECEIFFYTDRIDSYFEYLNWKKLACFTTTYRTTKRN